MNLNQIMEMQNNGIVFGAHTVSHQSLTRQEPEEQVKQIARSKADLGKLLGQEIGAFAYPYGSYNARSREIVSAAGFKCAFTLHRGVNTRATDPFALRRMRVPDSLIGFLAQLCIAPMIELVRPFRRRTLL
jgi:peptidoglycan/xylan/chitin deacetylase (PgdA/CDA1 family)